MTKIYQTKIFLIDICDDLNEEEIKILIENAFEMNSLSVIVRFDEIKKNIDKWTDENKFNFGDTEVREFEKEFE